MTALTKIEKFQLTNSHFSEEQINLIKNSICKGASNEELQFFIYACQRTGLDPFAKQIYSVPRGGQRTIQTSVDGFRLIADRSGKYAPGKEPTFEYDKNGSLLSATSYVKKQTRDGTWHEISANAHFDEYNANTPLWKKMPRAMLAKCAECLSLRKAFPAEMSGIYGQEEMDQADKENPNVKQLYKLEQHISTEQAIELTQLLQGCSPNVQKEYIPFMKQKYKFMDTLEELPESEYQKQKDILTVRYKNYQNELVEKEMANKPEVETV